MFFNEAFTARRSPLAHVWLAANLEKKLNKNVFLHADITESCKQIIEQPEGPLALRLTGTLLFGVATIYKKKTDYLVLETRDALKRIKTTYKPADVDLPETATAAPARPQQLVLEKKITEQNLQLMPANRPDLGDMDLFGAAFGGSQLLASQRDDSMDVSMFDDMPDHSIEVGRSQPTRAHDDEDDLDLDLDLDMDMDMPENGDRSVEVGRAADGARASDEEDLDLDLDLPGFEDDADPFGVGQAAAPEAAASPDMENPLTPTNADLLGDSVEVVGQEDELSVRPRRRQRAKTGTVRLTKAQVDDEIVLRSSDTQPDIDAITQEIDELPADPVAFAHATIGAVGLRTPVGISALLAPEAVMARIEPSRKRRRAADDDAASTETPNKAARSDQELDFDDSVDLDLPDTTANNNNDDDEDLGFERFDDGMEQPTEEPQVDPFSQDVEDTATDAPTRNGISKNTLMAAEKLRGALDNAESVDLSDLVASNQRRPNVTMFFEMLVLATKDAVSLKQTAPYGDISVSSKEALYGPLLSETA